MRTPTSDQHAKKTATPVDPRWASVQARDPAADKLFVYAVKTTGVYCRPSSPTRLPHLENVEFFDTPEAAEAAGYRPSKRAASDQTSVAAHHAELVAEACRRIEAADDVPSLKTLADDAGLSHYHFHRIFKRVTGRRRRAMPMPIGQEVRAHLGRSHSVTGAIYEADSTPAAILRNRTTLGMTPTTTVPAAPSISDLLSRVLPGIDPGRTKRPWRVRHAWVTIKRAGA
jgi:AraC family transcriptional regulator of adaptative response/methylated-DNA-[protein]-cysteine methyltransferase